MTAIGIDSGSVALKGAVVCGEELLSVATAPAGADPEAAGRAMIEGLLSGLAPGVRICATGYGREMVSCADESISEIFANVLGAGWAWRNWEIMPQIASRFRLGHPSPARRPDRFRTIVDIGGQDSKIITFDAEGGFEGFAMNDRCAAGTGRFLQELALVLEADGVAGLDTLAMESRGPGRISSVCTVFAESEVVSLISAGTPRSDIAAGTFEAVAERAAELAGSLRWTAPVLFDGGTALLTALRRALEASLGADVAVPACPQHITAIGAAVHADGIRDNP